MVSETAVSAHKSGAAAPPSTNLGGEEIPRNGLSQTTPPRRSRRRRCSRPLRKTKAKIFIRRAKSVMMSTELHNDASKMVDDARGTAIVGPDLGQGSAFAGAPRHITGFADPEHRRASGSLESTPPPPPAANHHHRTNPNVAPHATTSSMALPPSRGRRPGVHAPPDAHPCLHRRVNTPSRASAPIHSPEHHQCQIWAKDSQIRRRPPPQPPPHRRAQLLVRYLACIVSHLERPL